MFTQSEDISRRYSGLKSRTLWRKYSKSLKKLPLGWVGLLERVLPGGSPDIVLPPTRGAAKVSRVHWSSRFRLQHRVADHYRNGRLLLVGDGGFLMAVIAIDLSKDEWLG
jgi:2-polyprenyl-6-methoxyphenol hydroxylase-like FAD-dependent oxidoreductase